MVNQTYKKQGILIVDDCSTDESGAICYEYKCDDRVRDFDTEKRKLSCAWSLGLDKAHGEWIGFVDCDDWIESDQFQKEWITSVQLILCALARMK